ERDLPPSRAVMFAPNNLSELYQVADIMFTNELNSLYLFHSYWQGANPSIDGINPTLFPNGAADLTALKQYCAQRGISLWFHGNSGYVSAYDPLYGGMSPTGLSPDLARAATGTLLTDVTSTSTSFHVRPDSGCQPFTAPPPWGDYSTLYPPNYPGDFSSYINLSNDLYSAYSVQVISPTDWLVTNLTHKVVNNQWTQNHPAGSRVDFMPNYGGGAFIPDSRSPLLATQARTFGTFLNQYQIPYANYDGQDINEDLGYWGPRRFSQCLYESMDHPAHASQAAMTAPFGHFEYLFNRIQKHEGGKGFVLEISQIGGLAPLRLWDPSFMATHLDEDQWAFGCAAGYAPNFMIFGYHIGTDLNTIRNQGQWSQVVYALDLWQAVAPYLSTSQMATLKSFATDFYVPSQTGNQWVITPTRAMLRNGVDSPWQLMVERGPISPHQFTKANGATLSSLTNPYSAQTPQIELLVLPGMSATNANNVSLLATSPLSFTSTNTVYNWSYSALGFGPTLNMSASRGIAITLTGDNSGSIVVFNIGNRDYAVTVNFSGTQTIEIPNGEVVWYRSNAGYGYSKSGTADTFNYASVSTFKLFLGYVPNGVAPNISVSAIKTMKEDQATGLVNPVLTLNGNSVTVAGTIAYNKYLTYSGGSSAQVYDANWNYLTSLPVTGATLTAVNGANTFSVVATNSPNAWMATRVKVSGTPWIINKPAPVHEWRLENNTLDVAGTANGTVINSPTYVAGIEGSAALSFNGVNQYVNIPNLADMQFASTNSFTISAWVKLNSLPNAATTIIAKDGSGGSWYGLGITAGNQWTFQGTTDIVSPGTADVGQWHLLMGVQDATVGARKLYVDGVLAASGMAQDGSGTGALRVAAQPGGSPGQWLNGTVDDVRLYNQAVAQNDAGLLATNLATSAGGIISYAVSGGQLILDWPSSQGWQLQMQTNSIGTGLGTNWSTVIGATPPYTVGIDSARPTAFYRLTHP
ncbi:MAG: LamG domain-containing protein, partial [Verrucomicrobiota bacterium]